MISGIEFGQMCLDVCRLHQLYPKRPDKAFRKEPPGTPYGVHPVFLATLIMQEPNLAEDERILGAKVLLGHDLKEDTTAELPVWCQVPEVLSLIDELTFKSEEDQLVVMWNRSPKAIFYKTWDNVGNLIAVSHKLPARIMQRKDCVRRQLLWVEERCPGLEIVKIGWGLLGESPCLVKLADRE